MSCSDCGDLVEAGPGCPLVQALLHQVNSSCSNMGPGHGQGTWKCCWAASIWMCHGAMCFQSPISVSKYVSAVYSWRWTGMYDCLAPGLLCGESEGKGEDVSYHMLLNLLLKSPFCLQPAFMHNQGSLPGYQRCPSGTRQDLVSRKLWRKDAHCGAGSVVVLHALMALLAFKYHDEINQGQGALHATQSSRNWSPACSLVWT